MNERLVCVSKPHISYRGGRYRKPWVCRMPSGGLGCGYRPVDAYLVGLLGRCDVEARTRAVSRPVDRAYDITLAGN